MKVKIRYGKESCLDEMRVMLILNDWVDEQFYLGLVISSENGLTPWMVSLDHSVGVQCKVRQLSNSTIVEYRCLAKGKDVLSGPVHRLHPKNLIRYKQRRAFIKQFRNRLLDPGFQVAMHDYITEH